MRAEAMRPRGVATQELGLTSPDFATTRFGGHRRIHGHIAAVGWPRRPLPDRHTAKPSTSPIFQVVTVGRNSPKLLKSSRPSSSSLLALGADDIAKGISRTWLCTASSCSATCIRLDHARPVALRRARRLYEAAMRQSVKRASLGRPAKGLPGDGRALCPC
ncbi:uncharacterized protein BDZ99DRAFT_76660 [Mytilinidion resinicola]|uniref:Uncharacterized protein n=1 Tax=Mytilinidion resinicola TaxID=574789 RepID=A0A6A6YFC3_9PEZI|nr:uncharacterized protein BDZ99DRAFT_76660 [Mytilinidion resinicola]KAF2807233.1 hypothetical protein BDZ99DRAFT_76660 [Mytilinidion resinicola]